MGVDEGVGVKSSLSKSLMSFEINKAVVVSGVGKLEPCKAKISS